MHQDVVLYFTDESRMQEALQAGATYAGGIDLIPKVIICVGDRVNLWYLIFWTGSRWTNTANKGVLDALATTSYHT